MRWTGQGASAFVSRHQKAMIFRNLSKGLAIAILAMISGAAGAATAEDQSTPLRVMSFNIRNSGARDGTNSWKYRQDYFFQVIEHFSPDLIGFQEVLADQYDDILARMKDYSFSGVARDDGKRKGEWALLGFRRARFEKLDSGDFWLSEHPEQIGSVSWDAALTRICSWAKLRDRETSREFLYANTHFDHKGSLARENSARLIAKRLTAMSKGIPIVLTGDFNATEDTKAYTAITRPDEHGTPTLVDSYREVHPQRMPDEASFNGFKPVVKGSRIDFIFHSAELKATAATIERDRSPAQKFASDHYAVTAVLHFAGR
jgi:endonuclease/exonuclease/phosphatase family metal-dependent hydrolase